MFVEYQKRLNQVVLSIPLEIAENEIELNPKAVIINKKEIQLPLSIKPNSTRLHYSHNWIHLQSMIQSSSTNEPSEVVNLIPNELNCFACDHKLMVDFRPQKSIDLPSDHWYEMTECWACHHEDYTKLPGQEGGTIFAQRDVLMYSNNYYLIHPANALDALDINVTGREVRFYIHWKI